MPNTIDVYIFDLDRPELDFERLSSLLEAEELERAGKFRREIDRRRYIVRRGQLRELLSHHAGRSPGGIRFVCNEFGKPFLEGSHTQFNVSHSAAICMIAITRGKEVGCDIEWSDPTFPSGDTARAFFAPSEAQRLRELDVSQRVEGFFNCWTRKEAYVKARGYGVSLPLDSFEVSLAPGEPAALLSGCSGWSVQSFQPVPGFQAAVVAQGTDWRLSFKDLSDNPVAHLGGHPFAENHGGDDDEQDQRHLRPIELR
jgi:4'-phosphopantetheinyl transferase